MYLSKLAFSYFRFTSPPANPWNLCISPFLKITKFQGRFKQRAHAKYSETIFMYPSTILPLAMSGLPPLLLTSGIYVNPLFSK